MDERMTRLLTCWHLVLGQFYGGQVSRATLNLGQETWPLENSVSRGIYIYSILSTIPTVASNNLVLGWNCWLTSALLHHSVNQPYVGASEIPIWFTIVVTSLRSGGKNKRHDPHNHHPCMFVRTKNWSSPQLVLKHVVNRLPVPLVNAFGVS